MCSVHDGDPGVRGPQRPAGPGTEPQGGGGDLRPRGETTYPRDDSMECDPNDNWKVLHCAITQKPWM